MKNSNNVSIEKKLRRYVVGLLGHQVDLTLGSRCGSYSHKNGKRESIVIDQTMSEFAKDPAQEMSVLFGITAHECGHLLYSDFAEYRKYWQKVEEEQKEIEMAGQRVLDAYPDERQEYIEELSAQIGRYIRAAKLVEMINSIEDGAVEQQIGRHSRSAYGHVAAARNGCVETEIEQLKQVIDPTIRDCMSDMRHFATYAYRVPSFSPQCLPKILPEDEIREIRDLCIWSRIATVSSQERIAVSEVLMDYLQPLIDQKADEITESYVEGLFRNDLSDIPSLMDQEIGANDTAIEAGSMNSDSSPSRPQLPPEYSMKLPESLRNKLEEKMNHNQEENQNSDSSSNSGSSNLNSSKEDQGSDSSSDSSEMNQGSNSENESSSSTNSSDDYCESTSENSQETNSEENSDENQKEAGLNTEKSSDENQDPKEAGSKTQDQKGNSEETSSKQNNSGKISEEMNNAEEADLPEFNAEQEELRAKSALRESLERIERQFRMEEGENEPFAKGTGKAPSLEENLPDPGSFSDRHEGVTTQFIPDYKHTDLSYTGRSAKKECESMRYAVNAFARKMKALLLFKADDEEIAGMRSGKINRRQLYRALTDQKVFKKCNPGEPTSVKIQVLLDLSGSMSGEKLEDAIKASYLLTEACAQIQIPISVMGHHTASIGFDSGMVLHQYLKFKDYKKKSARERIFSAEATGANRDGLAIFFAGYDLYKNSESQDEKILLVISDGCPNHQGYRGSYAVNDVKEIVEKMKKQWDIHTVGIGIGYDTEHVHQIYDDHVLVPDVDNLSKELLKILKKTLKV